jgi:hypothetical protein
MSSASGFDEQRQRVIALVKQWEDEVSKWEHGLLVVWKKFLAPLKALLK